MNQRLSTLDEYGLDIYAELLEYCKEEARYHSAEGASCYLAFGAQRLIGSGLPEALAKARFGDPNRIYDLGERLRNESDFHEAIYDAPGHYELVDRGSLRRYVEQNGACVVVLDDAQAVDPKVVYTLSSLVDTGDIEGNLRPNVDLNGTIFLACFRLSLPSIRELIKPRVQSSSITPLDLWYLLAESLRNYLSDTVRDRCRWCLEELTQAFNERLKLGHLDEPLLRVPEDTPGLWTGEVPPHPTPPDWEWVEDIYPLPRGDASQIEHDVFISYRHRRNGPLARRLAKSLAEEWHVWIDQDSLDVQTDSPVEKARLIRELSRAVSGSSCSILFALAHRSPKLPPGMGNEEAIRRGLAIRDSSGSLVEWSWQHLELELSQCALIIDEIQRKTYVIEKVAGSKLMPRGPAQQQRTYASFDELAEIASDFVARNRGRDDLPQSTLPTDESLYSGLSPSLRGLIWSYQGTVPGTALDDLWKDNFEGTAEPLTSAAENGILRKIEDPSPRALEMPLADSKTSPIARTFLRTCVRSGTIEHRNAALCLEFALYKAEPGSETEQELCELTLEVLRRGVAAGSSNVHLSPTRIGLNLNEGPRRNRFLRQMVDTLATDEQRRDAMDILVGRKLDQVAKPLLRLAEAIDGDGSGRSLLFPALGHNRAWYRSQLEERALGMLDAADETWGQLPALLKYAEASRSSSVRERLAKSLDNEHPNTKKFLRELAVAAKQENDSADQHDEEPVSDHLLRYAAALVYKGMRPIPEPTVEEQRIQFKVESREPETPAAETVERPSGIGSQVVRFLCRLFRSHRPEN